MKVILYVLMICCSISLQAKAEGRMNLLQFFQQAVSNDPTYLQVLEETLATEQGISINRAALLPNIAFTANPKINKLNAYGAIANTGLYPDRNTLQSFPSQLTATQAVISFAQLSNLASAKLSAQIAQANLNAAFQDLILRVAKAYLRVLYDEENLAYCKASKAAFGEQLAEAKQLYQAGSINNTDVYTAESAYSSSKARYITAEAILASDKDFLGTIIGEDVTSLAELQDSFPITAPKPLDREIWVKKAKEQNWSVKSSSIAMRAFKELIKHTMAGHLPSLELQVSYGINPSNSSEGGILFAPGASKLNNAAIGLNLNVPIYSGGLVVASTKRAQHNYLKAQRQFDASLRNTIHSTRESYLNIIASMEKIRADKATIQSTISSLKGIQDRYRSGSGTMVDLLNQQERVLQAKTQYATNRYDYIINLLTLKNSAGTLSVKDLEIINSWLR